MAAVLRESTWHGCEALTLENDGIRVTVVPETGGRLVSLFDKIRSREWLLSPEESHPVRSLAYGADFNSQTPGGWDEMFPTILAEAYPIPGEFFGVSLPDHGELWTVPWAVEQRSDETITLSAEGRALPYRLARRLSLTEPGALSLHYELTHLGSTPLHCLWAAHPQFACNPGVRIALPDEVHDVINVLPLEWGPAGTQWGPPGSRNAWPRKIDADGQAHVQDVVGAPALKRGRKFYIPPDAPISRAGLIDQAAGCSLWMEWNATAIPYCGVWIDEGALNARPSVAIEPTTGYYDTLNAAWKNRRLAVIQPGAAESWTISIRLAGA